ncbi:MAG: ABC transporter ATP-binding protein, partial [Chitinophagaceae bacterium]
QYPQQIKQIIGVQLQSCSFYPSLNLIELLHLFAALYNVSINALEVLKKVDLVSKARAKYNQLSGGQKQRFSIATTLLHKPKIIFLDEPTTGLDPHARRSLWQLIQQIRNEGATIVLTTHYLEEAEFLCDTVGIIDQGTIIAINTPSQLIDDLLSTGFSRPVEVKKASLEDVFIHLTGKSLVEI